MDVICVSAKGLENGCLQNYSIDFDTTDTMDFEISVGVNNREILEGKGMWYIAGTEYGGVVDSIEVVTEENKLLYTGRNFRAVLASKIVQPYQNEDYRIVSGNLANVAEMLIKECGLNEMFVINPVNAEIKTYQIPRYITLYDALVIIAYSCGKIIGFDAERNKIHIFFTDRIDYSAEMEYCQDNINFRIKKYYNTVNHLICLGKGELKDRLVVHLYVDRDGDIVEKPYYVGTDEITSVYENTNLDTVEELKKEGADKLGEIKNGDSFEVIAPEGGYKIGDVIGGYESITGFRVRREIVNIIATITDDCVDISYTVGGDEPGAAGLPSDIIEEYILPIATQQTLGGIKIGSDFVIENGVIGCPSIRLCKETIEKTSKICA